jgi:hypothetical protein
LINLSEFEAGAKYPGNYDKDLEALQERLSRVLVSHIVHRRRSLVVCEGWIVEPAGAGAKKDPAKGVAPD